MPISGFSSSACCRVSPEYVPSYGQGVGAEESSVSFLNFVKYSGKHEGIFRLTVGDR
jgi:hypothetical protein